MRIITELEKMNITEPTVVILGKFDGVHKGHQLLLDEARKISLENNLKTVVFTFDFKLGTSKLLTNKEERRSLLKEKQIDYLIECPFEDIRNLEAEVFMEDVVIKKLNAKIMVAGTDCGFGKERRGDASFAKSFMEQHGYRAVIIDKLLYDNREISSSYIREELTEGSLDVVNDMLGYEYFFEGVVQGGKKIGRTMNFPTVNLYPAPSKVLPVYGVYASKINMDDECYADSDYCAETLHQRTFYGVTNIGIKPTVGSAVPCVETYIFDYDGDAYGKNIRVSLEWFVRAERRFEGLEDLKMQIARDIENVKMRMQ